MRRSRILQQTQRFLLASAAVLFTASNGAAQGAAAMQRQETPWTQDLDKYPGLVPEFGQLFEGLMKDVKLPDARTESRLLPLLPPSTVYFASLPNYGDSARQALQVFRGELTKSSVLRDWWSHGTLATAAPQIEDSLDKFWRLHQYLGDEIVFFGAMEEGKPSFMLLSGVRKPGLREFLDQLTEQLGGRKKAGVRVLHAKELAKLRDTGRSQDLLVLVRSDYAVAADDFDALRSFNERLDRRTQDFVASAFGKRVAQEYPGGLTILAAVDLQEIVKQASPGTRENVTFQQSGFADVQYLIWGHKGRDAEPASQGELSFNGPRRGAAAWLRNSGPLSNLDFLSPHALAAGTVSLAPPAQIFEEMEKLAAAQHSSTFASVPQVEKALGINLKDDLLSLLGGEVAFELDGVAPPKPAWKVVFNARDASHLEKTLSTLLKAASFPSEDSLDGGITYHSFQIPSSRSSTEIDYAFTDGHLIFGSSRGAVADSVRLHRSGGSAAKSEKFAASLPAHSLQASALFYYDPVALAAMDFRRLFPGMADLAVKSPGDAVPAVLGLYAQENSIREASNTGGYDIAAPLVVAAIVIPNLLRSKVAANEASAVGSVRIVVVAQVSYASSYGDRGFAPNLASLGPGPGGSNAPSPDHAGEIDEKLGHPGCKGDSWCTKSGYQFQMKVLCKGRRCDDFVVVATPVDASSGTRSFCSTSDGIIRWKSAVVLTAPLSVAECKKWPALE